MNVATHQDNGHAHHDGWEEPQPLEDEALPAFPIAALPPPFRTYAAQVSEFTQTPIDMVAMLMLAAAGAAIAQKARIRIKPGYYEPANLYAVIALPPAERKSAVFALVMAPFRAYERELQLSVRDARLEVKARRASLEAQAKEARKAKEADKVSAIERELDSVEDVVDPRLMAEDVTPERLAVLLEQNGERLLVSSAEGGLFPALMGLRYSKGGDDNLDLLLKGHSGDAVRVDRMTRKGVTLDHPALTIACAVQPHVLQTLASKPGVRERGMLARLLFSLPESSVGRRNVDPRPIEETAERAYEAALRRLLELPLPPSGERPQLITLSDKARALWTNASRELEPRLGPEGDLVDIGDWSGKMPGAIARIAGALHAMGSTEAPWLAPVSAETMTAALRVGHYLLAHARRAFGMMQASKADADAALVLRWLQRHGPTTVTAKDIQRPYARRFKEAAQVERAFLALAERGYLRGGPLSPRGARAWETHPNLRRPADRA